MKDQELFTQYHKSKDISLRNQLVEKYLYMVDIVIRKYLNKGVDYDDLHQIGAMALISAVERFDPNKGFEFSSFATPTIIGEIKKYFRDKEWSVKVPRKIKEINSRLHIAQDTLTAKLHRNPTVPEMAEHMGLSEEEIHQAMEGRLAYKAHSLNQTFDEVGEEGEGHALEKFTATTEEGYDRLETNQILEKVLNQMSDTNRYIFRERFIENRSQAEIANHLGVSQMTVSRAENKIKSSFRQEAYG